MRKSVRAEKRDRDAERERERKIFLSLCISISLLRPFTFFSRSPLVFKTLFVHPTKLRKLLSFSLLEPPRQCPLFSQSLRWDLFLLFLLFLTSLFTRWELCFVILN